MKNKTLLGAMALVFVTGIILLSGQAQAKSNCEQDNSEGGGGTPVLYEEDTEQDTTITGLSYSRGGRVSTKRHWVVSSVVDCVETSYYQTYQVGICPPGMSRCNVKSFFDRQRMSVVC